MSIPHPMQQEIAQAFREGAWSQALEALEPLVREYPNDPRWRAWVGIARHGLYSQLQRELMNGRHTIKAAASDFSRAAGLDARSGYLLAMLADPMPVEDVVALSSLSAFETLQLIAHLARMGLVKVNR